MNLRHTATTVHGRWLYERRGDDRLLVGFHGYAETAAIHMAQLQSIPGVEEWSVAALQALHPFYVQRTERVVASWMTRDDRELAIADNIAYVRAVLAELPPPRTVVFAGFSQGVAMAWRALSAYPAAGLIALGGDVPPDVVESHPKLPPVLIGRGERDDWYTDEKLKKDLSFIEPLTSVELMVFDGGHEWTDAFRARAGQFLAKLSPRA